MVECDWVVVKVWLFQTCNFTFCECGAEWRWAGSSEIEVLLVKVKVVTVPNVCSLGGTSWLVLVGDTELLRFSSRKRNTGSKKKWRGRLPQCGPGLRGWKLKLGTQDGLVMRKYLYRSWCLFHHVAIPSIGIAVYDLQRAAAGKRLQHRLQWAWHHWGREWEPWRRQRSGETLGYRHRSMKRCKWKVSFLMDNGMDILCLMFSWNMHIANLASLLMTSWTEQCWMCLKLSLNGNIVNTKLIGWLAEWSLVLR